MKGNDNFGVIIYLSHFGASEEGSAFMLRKQNTILLFLPPKKRLDSKVPDQFPRDYL